jgi:hypothetical protein
MEITMTKRENASIASLGAVGARFSITALLLGLAACATDPAPIAADEADEAREVVSTAEQQACTPRRGVGCTILRPVGWNELGTGCVEGPDTTIFRGDGGTYTAIGVPTQIFGSGFTTLLCDGGCLRTIDKVCRKGPPIEQ